MAEGVCTTIDPMVLTNDDFLRPEAAVLSGVKWLNGSKLSVFFMNGAQVFREAVREHAPTWSQFANITFNFVTDPNAVIRISMEGPFTIPKQFNSSLGSQASQIPSSQPTMNLGFFPGMDPAEIRRLILHEFGHALGLVHEHQSPNSGVVFNRQAAIAHYRRFGFTEKMVEENIIHRFSFAEVSNATEFDPKSIMTYDLPAEVANPATKVNPDLSDLDKKFIGSTEMYPKKVTKKNGLPVGIPIIVDTPPRQDFLVLPGQEIIYHVVIATDGRYVIETTGSQALVMSLLNSTDANTPRKEDFNGSGIGLNARIIDDLPTGTYFVKIKHRLSNGTGSFSISARKAV